MKHDISFYHRGGSRRGSRLEPLARFIVVRLRDKRPIPELSYASDAIFRAEEKARKAEQRRLAAEEEAEQQARRPS